MLNVLSSMASSDLDGAGLALAGFASQATAGVTLPAALGAQISEQTALVMYVVGVVSVAMSWVTIVALFAWRNELPSMMNLIMRGPVIKFVTVTYIVVVIVTLGLINRLEHDDISTLLAAIAGYVLGDRRSEGRAASPAPRKRAAPELEVLRQAHNDAESEQ
jgi:hypothetical protein